MGVEHSRKVFLPEDIDQPEVRTNVIMAWESMRYDDSNRNQHAGTSSMSSGALERAGILLNGYFGQKEIVSKDGVVIFDNFDGDNLTVLEVFGGNGVATKILSEKFTRGVNWMCTDIIEYPQWGGGNSRVDNSRVDNSRVIFEKLNSVDAVAKYGLNANILLLVSPPPNSSSDLLHGGVYGDYYACKDFIEMNRKSTAPKFIVFCGELGAADGSQGMYRYLFEHPNLISTAKGVIQVTTDPLFGDKCVKELFIFALKY